MLTESSSAVRRRDHETRPLVPPGPDDLQKLVYASDSGFALPCKSTAAGPVAPFVRTPVRNRSLRFRGGVLVIRPAAAFSTLSVDPHPRPHPGGIYGTKNREEGGDGGEGWSSEGRQPPAEGCSLVGGYSTSAYTPFILFVCLEKPRGMGATCSDRPLPAHRRLSPRRAPRGKWWVAPPLAPGNRPDAAVVPLSSPRSPAHGKSGSKGGGRTVLPRRTLPLRHGACLARRGQREPG